MNNVKYELNEAVNKEIITKNIIQKIIFSSGTSLAISL